MNGQIKVGAGGSGDGGNMLGHIAITGDVNGGSPLGPSIWVIGGNLDGQICVGGSMNDDARIAVTGSFLNAGVAYEIDVAGSMDELAAIVFDYDGWHDGDEWENGATVRIGEDTYTQNTPAARVWEIQPCRGDMNNDGLVNAFDIDPFILALSDVAGYEEAFPGLEGSRGYHGDCNCSDAFNNFDIDPFVNLIITQCCTSDCEPCENNRGEGAAGPVTAAEIAALLRENTANERQDALLVVVATAADSDDAATATLWTDVFALLVE